MAGLNVPQRGRHQYLSSKEAGLLAGKTETEASGKEVLMSVGHSLRLTEWPRQASLVEVEVMSGLNEASQTSGVGLLVCFVFWYTFIFISLLLPQSFWCLKLSEVSICS